MRAVGISLTMCLAVMSGTANAMSKSELGDLRNKALTILENNPMDAAITKLKEPSNGLIDLDGSGLHTWAFEAPGRILWDHSGQTQPGMDISSLTAPDGEALVKKVMADVRNDDGRMVWQKAVPHPVTGEVKAAHLACAEFGSAKFMCVMAWP
jgi:hypothetical protein